MNRLLERMFENRGYSKDMIISMDEPLGGKLLDIDLFCSVLHQAYLNHDPVVILSDFDMDGIMGGVIGYAGLAELGFSVSLFCPDPSEGYGFSKKTIDRLLSEFSNTKVIVTADTGISELDSISYAKSLGMTVLVTDHHVQKQVSAADVIVDPSRLDEVYPNPGICGACVLYFCLKEYAALYGTLFQQEQIDRLCLFAGIGTVAFINKGDDVAFRLEILRQVFQQFFAVLVDIRLASGVMTVLVNEGADDGILIFIQDRTEIGTAFRPAHWC